MATKRALILATALCVLAGCGSESDISRALQIVIPAEVPTIQNGTVYLSLWSYEGDVASASATLLDVEQSSFSHSGGQATAIILSVHGKPPGSSRKHYLTVEGCVPGSGGATSVFNAFVMGSEQSMAVVAPSATPGTCTSAH